MKGLTIHRIVQHQTASDYIEYAWHIKICQTVSDFEGPPSRI